MNLVVRRVIVAMALLGVSGLSCAAEDRAGSERIAFNITAPALIDALIQFTEQSGLQLALPSQGAKGLRAPRVVGELTAKAALDQLLNDSGLKYEFTNDRTVSITAVGPVRDTAVRDPMIGSRVARLDASEAPSAASAQSSTEQNTSSGKPQDEGIGEIVVTAQKRAERLQDVPIAMSVLSGDDLDSSTVRDVTEALSRAPGIAIQDSIVGGFTQVTVRGVAADGTAGLGAASTGYYLDSAPFAFVHNALVPSPDAYDLDRIEVLRGPQGTLYGASALNGVVRVLTKDANPDAVEFKARGLTSSSTDGGWNYRGDMAVNVPIVEGKVAARAVLGYQNLSGWIDKPTEEDANDVERRTARLKLNAQPTEQLSIGLSAWLSRGDYGAPSIGFEDRQSLSSVDEPITDDFNVYSLTVSYDFSAFTLNSMTSYLDYSNTSILDNARTPVFELVLDSRFGAHTFAQEFALNSTHEGPWRWTAGAMYRDSKEQQAFFFPPFFVTPGAARMSSESYAVFGELTRAFADGRWDATVGARYFEDKVGRRETSRFEPFTADDLTAVEETFHATTPRVILAWHPSEQMNVYASYSQGFRSGVHQNPIPLPPVEPDKLTNYELGSKGSLLGGRLVFDTAVYYVDWQDVQQSLSVIVPGTNICCAKGLVNGDSASGIGVDFGITAKPVDALELGINASWNDLTVDAPVFTGNGTLLFDEGVRLNNSAEYTVGGFADYMFALGGGGLQGVFSIGANYTSALPSRDLIGSQAVVNDGDSMLITRASVAIRAPQGWTATLFVDNLNDEDGSISRIPGAAYPDWETRIRPRTIGLQFEYQL